MRFTRWTYWVAMRRAMKAETLEFRQNSSAPKTLRQWMSCWEFTDALRRRKQREGK